MTHKFIAEAIACTQSASEAQRFEITFADASGQLHAVSIPAAIARGLSSALEDFAAASRSKGPVATKMPRQFAVGSGRFQPVVLVRFEDDIPYGLEASQAAKLGRALVAQAEIVSTEPIRH